MNAAELPEGCATWLDAACQTLAGFHPSLKQSAIGCREARAELAALRQRAEDAEMMLRAIGPIGWWMNYDEGKLWSPNELLPYGINIDPTGLPILTDEARKALRAKR